MFLITDKSWYKHICGWKNLNKLYMKIIRYIDWIVVGKDQTHGIDGWKPQYGNSSNI